MPGPSASREAGKIFRKRANALVCSPGFLYTLRFPIKFSGKRTGYALLAVAYVLSAILVFRHVSRSAEPGRVTIRVCQWQLETGVREAFDAMIRRYEQINPRFHVVQIAVPGGPLYTSWVLTQMVGGTGPDLVQYTWNAPDIPRMLQPITADVEKPNPYTKGTPLEGVPWRDTFIDGMTSPDAYIDSRVLELKNDRLASPADFGYSGWAETSSPTGS